MKPASPSAREHTAHGADVVNVFLKPGEYFVGGRVHRIRTLLGSCVSITLWHPTLRIGAMSHFLLSARLNGRVGLGGPLDARYGEEAMSLMTQELKLLGAWPQQCQAKIFGGGDMFPHRPMTAGPGVGRKNGEAARELLEAHGIEVCSESLFGMGHRRIVFDVASGEVWSHQVDPGKAAHPLKVK